MALALNGVIKCFSKVMKSVVMARAILIESGLGVSALMAV